MAQVHKTISISKEHDEFISENKINVSRLVQDHIDLLMSRAIDPDSLRTIADEAQLQRETKEKIQVMLQKIIDFCQKKGLGDEVAKLYNV
jgi:hypothetical protein